jgi:hypothetical protein
LVGVAAGVASLLAFFAGASVAMTGVETGVSNTLATARLIIFFMKKSFLVKHGNVFSLGSLSNFRI